VTNDTLAPLRSLFGPRERAARRGFSGRSFRARRLGAPGSEGRWSLLLAPPGGKVATETERRVALAETLLLRYGVVTRETVHAEGVAGGFSAVYEVLKRMEEAGRVRRGYFVAGLGAAPVAPPGAPHPPRAPPGPPGGGRPP